MYLDKKSETLKVIQQLRNEAHRFGLTLHRNIRSKNALKSPLDQVEGIGPKTKELLLKEFKSLKRIKATSKQDIIDILGKVKGVKIYQKLQGL
jgi:excinuclease ABC subunit C